MERLVTVVQELSLARDLATVMRIVRTTARALTGADGATFILRDRDLCFYADEDAIAPLWKGHRFPMSACISGWAMLNRREAVIEDIYADARIPHAAYAPTFVKSLVMVPIRTLEPLGAIGNYWAEPHLATPEEVRLLQALADVTAVALENVRVYEELEARVAARTHELELANADLDSFAHSVSHDLRAPVRAIDGFCAMSIEDHGHALPPDLRRNLDIIGNEARRMGRLITDLLAFARLGRAPIARADLDMTALARAEFERARSSAQRTELSIGSLPAARGDPGLVAQVWANLLSNAVKFSSKAATPHVEIEGRTLDGEHVYSIRDNGAGFDPQYAAKLFVPFQRLHTQAEFAGTGVGLALVQRIVSRHGGRIWADGKPGAGAVFHFTLPSAA